MWLIVNLCSGDMTFVIWFFSWLTCFTHITHSFQNFIHVTESEWKFNLIYINKKPKPWVNLISSPPRETCWIFKIVTGNISLLCYCPHLLSRSTRSNHYQNRFNFTEVLTASWKASSLGEKNRNFSLFPSFSLQLILTLLLFFAGRRAQERRRQGAWGHFTGILTCVGEVNKINLPQKRHSTPNLSKLKSFGSASESDSVMPTLCDPMDYTSPQNSLGQNTGVGILSFSRGSSQPRTWTGVSCIAGGFFTNWALREAPCSSKEIVNKTKRQPTEWEKTFANEVTNKGVISKIYKKNHAAQQQ